VFSVSLAVHSANQARRDGHVSAPLTGHKHRLSAGGRQLAQGPRRELPAIPDAEIPERPSGMPSALAVPESTKAGFLTRPFTETYLPLTALHGSPWLPEILNRCGAADLRPHTHGTTFTAFLHRSQQNRAQSTRNAPTA
jgi:hypothetical protein